MRGIGLIITGFLVTACGGPDADVSSSTGANVEEEVAAGNEVALDEQLEPRPAPEVTSAGKDPQVERASPCTMQGAKRLQVAPIRAVGTEPFWGARVQGRCVTYSTPEDQQGTRIWTRYSEAADGRGVWIGQLNGKSFEMRTRSAPGCSDGMSDNRYPIAVELLVNGEERSGCAKPL